MACLFPWQISPSLLIPIPILTTIRTSRRSRAIPQPANAGLSPTSTVSMVTGQPSPSRAPFLVWRLTPGTDCESSMKHNSPPASTVLFAVLILVSVIFWWNPLRDTLSLALSNDAYTHILLIVPLSIALIFTGPKHIDRKPLPDHLRVDRTLNWILPPLALALALTIGGYARWGMLHSS